MCSLGPELVGNPAAALSSLRAREREEPAWRTMAGLQLACCHCRTSWYILEGGREEGREGGREGGGREGGRRGREINSKFSKSCTNIDSIATYV